MAITNSAPYPIAEFTSKGMCEKQSLIALIDAATDLSSIRGPVVECDRDQERRNRWLGI